MANADGGRRIGADSFCLTLMKGECNEWSIFGGDDGGVRVQIGTVGSMVWSRLVVEYEPERNAGFRGRGRFEILENEKKIEISRKTFVFTSVDYYRIELDRWESVFSVW